MVDKNTFYEKNTIGYGLHVGWIHDIFSGSRMAEKIHEQWFSTGSLSAAGLRLAELSDHRFQNGIFSHAC